MSVQFMNEPWLASQLKPAFTATSKGRLLISIADRYLRTLLEAVLEREGYETTAAPIESVELSSHTLHDLLITDAETLGTVSNLADLVKSIRIIALDWRERTVPTPLATEVTVVDPLRTDLLLANVQYLCQISRLERENRLLRRALSRGTADDASEGGASLSDRVEQFERNLISTALRRTQGSQVRAARLLGVKTTTLNMKLKRYNIDATEFRQPAPNLI